MFREWNGFHFAFAVEFNHRFCYFSERLGVAGATVENTGNAVLLAPNVHRGDIAYIHEIAAEVFATGEEFRVFTFENLII